MGFLTLVLAIDKNSKTEFCAHSFEVGVLVRKPNPIDLPPPNLDA